MRNAYYNVDLRSSEAISYSEDVLIKSGIEHFYVPYNQEAIDGFKALGQLLGIENTHRHYMRVLNEILSEDVMGNTAKKLDGIVRKLGYRETAHAIQENSKSKFTGRDKFLFEWGKVSGILEMRAVLSDLISESKDNRDKARRIVDSFIHNTQQDNIS